jgi:hypothetical protein
MNLKWLKHLKDSDKQKDFRQQIKAAWPVLERLKEILDEETLSQENWSVSQKSFDNPNWEFKMAFVTGDRHRCHKIKELINSVKETIDHDG